MGIIACLGWLILLVIVIAFMCCLMPWWLVLLVFGGMFIYNFFLCGDAPFKIQSRPYKPKKRKNKTEQQKKSEAKKNKITNSTSVNRTNANISAGTYYQKNDDFDYDRYIAAKKEEQAAYDDFIATLDMDD